MKTLKNSLVVSIVKHLLVAVVPLLPVFGGAQTILSGNISGTWSPSGNPYIIADDATVPSGQSLTVQPGVIVWIGEGVSITVNGAIQAVGTSAQHITFQPPINSQYWNSFSVNNSRTNIFTYCDFENATNELAFVGTSSNQVNYCTFTTAINTALAFNNQSGNQVQFSSFQDVSNGIAMKVNGNNWTLYANIANCSFSNCLGQAVAGTCNGTVNDGCVWNSGTIFSAINNYSFNAVNSGCSFILLGGCNCNCGPGYGNIQLMDNLFINVTNTAISLTQNGYADNSPATLINNIILNASNGIVSQDPWDARVGSCVFKNCGNAVVDTGSLSRTISYNDFFGNSTNFTGYSAIYGTTILANRNGTPCDLLYNIFQNPQFVSATDFHLQTNSLCIDAGVPDAAYFDSYFPPSLGSVTNDIGAYGGPNAGQWIVPMSTNFLTLTAARYIGVTINPPSAGHYQLQYASKLTGTNNWIQITNMDLSAPFLYTEPASSPARFYRAVLQ
jgi:hypothetical protein